MRCWVPPIRDVSVFSHRVISGTMDKVSCVDGGQGPINCGPVSPAQ